jgi:hypothetical protein
MHFTHVEWNLQYVQQARNHVGAFRGRAPPLNVSAPPLSFVGNLTFFL